jgi:hypothetical protein
MGPAGPEGPAGPSGAPVEETGSLTVGAEYAGSATCSGCHQEIYDAFSQSGHPWILNQVVDGQPPDFPFTEVPDPPEGYTWADIAYVVGGYNWKARFIDQNGYIVTTPPGAAGDAEYPNQYNLANDITERGAGWVTYHSGEENLPYDCGACHTTGYSPQGSQDEMEGIAGTWAEPGVQCEACHGPGGLHVQNPRGVQMTIDRDAETCGACHARGATGEVSVQDGFIQHHDQYQDLFVGKHAALDCVTCHDPHSGVVQLRQAEVQTTRIQCGDCHFQQAQFLNHPTFARCIDCHMPRLIQSAWGQPEEFTADIRTHLVAIDPNQIGQFNEEGTAALAQIGLNYACRSCHTQGSFATPKTDEELIERAARIHREPEPAE